MVDFRKLLLAFAAVALLVVLVAPANAQPAFSCTAFSNPVNVRAEGLAELVGDIELSCSGGQPTAVGTNVPQTNFVIGLNTNITSRLLGSGTGSGIDALLLIDEPFPSPANTKNPSNATITQPFTTAVVNQSAPCLGNTTGTLSTPTNCNVIPGNFAGQPYTTPSYAQTTCPPANVGGSANLQCSNIYIARQQDASHITWLGVPIDPPGTSGNLTLRFTNIRANANLLGVSSTLTSTQIFANISVNGSETFQINNNQLPVAAIIPGLISSVSGATALSQCANLNSGPPPDPNFFGTTSAGCAEFAVNVKEGFAASFKRRIAIAGLGTVTPANSPIGFNTAGVSPGTDGLQDVPGFNYNTESGFTPSVAGTFNTPPGGLGQLGVADTATRFLVKLNNVGAGTRLVFPLAVPLTVGGSAGSPVPPTNSADANLAGWTGGFLRLVAGTPDANGNFGVGSSQGFVGASGALNFTCFDTGVFSQNPFAVSLAAPWNLGTEVVATGGTALAVYEVVNADTAAIENANIPIGVAFISNTGQNLPATGQVTGGASFAPLSTVGVADPAANIPRFAPSGTPGNVFNITVCSCNLLFPFVTNQFGFDTGIAIANTSLDPYGTSPQSGTVKLNYYGSTTGGGAAPAAQTSQNVTAGSELIFTLSGGGNLGITATAGFEGYMIAQANFQYCHAFAFITYNLTQSSGIAEGYLAIQLDSPGLTRTNNIGENKAH